MSEQEHVYERITFLFSQGLTAEKALCLAGERIYISVPHLRKQLARIQLYRQCNLSKIGHDVLHGYRMMSVQSGAVLQGS